MVLMIVLLVSSIYLIVQIYQMTILDAQSRGFKNPKLWGIITSGSQNGGGLILYLIGRRKYPSTMSVEDKKEIEVRKNRIGVGLIFMVIAAIGLVLTITLTH